MEQSTNVTELQPQAAITVCKDSNPAYAGARRINSTLKPNLKVFDIELTLILNHKTSISVYVSESN
jgi:hypothetical protein